MQLREYQNNFIYNIQDSLENYRSVLGVLPTGSGKTVIISKLTELASIENKRVCIIAHRIELIEQISSALQKFNIKNSLVLPNQEINNQLVYVCSVDTLIRRLKKIQEPDLIIVDEAHHLASFKNKWGRCVEGFTNAKIIGLTATPVRTNGQGLGIDSGGIFEDLVVGTSVEWLMQNNYLTDAKYFVLPQVADLTSVRTFCGDYNQSDLEERLNQSKVTGDAVAHYKRICPNSPAIVFCVSINHAQAVATEFELAGFKAKTIYGGLDKATRKQLITDLGNGNINVLTSVDVISEGTDVPIVQTAILLRPTQSLCLHLQQIGRVLRPYLNKKFAYILDHVGNTLRHGFADTTRDWSLSGEKKSRKEQEKTVAMKQCPECYCCHKPSFCCPSCEFKYKIKIKNLKIEQGELKELTKEEQRLIKEKQKQEIKKANSLEKLLVIEKKRGFKNGWALHVWQGKLLAREKHATR
jgi:DNA repair protein RadD